MMSSGSLRRYVVSDVAAVLSESFPAGARILLLFPPGLDFVIAFLACLRAGRVAVPAIPPDPHKPARSLSRLAHLVRDAAPAAVLSTDAVKPFRPILDEAVPALACLPWIDVREIPRAERRTQNERRHQREERLHVATDHRRVKSHFGRADINGEACAERGELLLDLMAFEPLRTHA